MATGTLIADQGGDASKVLADARTAMGGKKLETLTTLSATGRTLRTDPTGTTRETEFEVSLALPDKYLMRSVIMAMGNMSIYRNTGFNGGQAIEEIDRPPNLAGGGNMVIRMGGAGGAAGDPEKMTPEQKAESDRLRLLANKKEFTRIALGMFAAAIPAYPLTFTYAAQAESPDGKADVIDVKGEGDFAVRLFVDAQTHMPLMLSWMDKEPLVMTMQSGPGGMTMTSGGGAAVMGGGTTFTQSSKAGGQSMSPEERDKMMKEFEAKRKEMEANRRTVEYRIFYADYKSVGGVMLPHKIARSIDGKATEEMIFDEMKVNPKIDNKKFEVSK
jgi:hypothetical protein